MPKKQSKSTVKKRRKPNLPDELIYKTPHAPGSAKEKHREEYFSKLKEEDLNPNGKEDFEKLLRGAIELGEDGLE